MTGSKKSFQIAIDGPVAAGKGSVSRQVADQLGFLYVDTGAMYRCVAFLAKENNIDYDDEAALLPLTEKADIDLRLPNETEQDGRLITVLLDGKDVSWDIRTEEISLATPHVARHPKVREVLVSKQQKIASMQNVVMEGRDITFRVLPDADLKVFLTASELVRARRRFIQLTDRSEQVTFSQVQQELLERDAMDSSRASDPLLVVDDAWVIDSSDLSINNIVDAIVNRVEAMRASSASLSDTV